MINYVVKMMNSALKMVILALNMMNSVFKMMNFPLKTGVCHPSVPAVRGCVCLAEQADQHKVPTTENINIEFCCIIVLPVYTLYTYIII